MLESQDPFVSKHKALNLQEMSRHYNQSRIVVEASALPDDLEESAQLIKIPDLGFRMAMILASLISFIYRFDRSV